MVAAGSVGPLSLAFVVAFLDRLYTAKRKVEERIAVLGGGDDSEVGNLSLSYHI